MLDNPISTEVERIQNAVSQKEQTEQRKLPQVGGIVEDVRPWYRKIADVFFVNDIPTTRKNIQNFVLKPLAKGFVKDLLIGAIEEAFSDGQGPRTSGRIITNTASSLVRSMTTGRSQVPYHLASKSGVTSVGIEQSSRINNPKWPFEDLVWDYQSQAKTMKDNILAEIATHGEVSIYQVYDAASNGEDVTGLDYTNWDWGWTKDNIGDPKVTRTNYGWWLQLPQPIQLPKKNQV